MSKRNDFMEGFLKGLYQAGVGNPEVQRVNNATRLEQAYKQRELDLKANEMGLVPDTGTPTATIAPNGPPPTAVNVTPQAPSLGTAFASAGSSDVNSNPSGIPSVTPSAPPPVSPQAANPSAQPSLATPDNRAQDITRKTHSFIKGLMGAVYPGMNDANSALNTKYKQDPNAPVYFQDATGKIGQTTPGSPMPAGSARMNREKGSAALASQWRDQNTTPGFSFAGTDNSGKPLILNTHTGEITVGSVPGGGPIQSKTYPTEIAKEVKDIDIQMGQVNDMEKLLSQIPSSVAGGIQSVGSKVTGGLYAPKAKQYNALKPAFAVKIYRAATGDTRLSDADAAARAYPMVPDLSDSAEVKKGKMDAIRKLLSDRRSIIATGKGTEAPWPLNPPGQPQPNLTPEDQQAIDWANANPTDPRAQEIRRLHGL